MFLLFIIIVFIILVNQNGPPPGRSGASERRGAAGERDIVSELPERIPLSRIFMNAYVEINDGFTEIDVIVLDETGIYVIESKNYSGFVWGNTASKYWKYKHKGGKEYSFYNPVWQNKTHVSAIKNQLKIDKSELVSYVVFGKSSKLGNISGKSDATILHIDYFLNAIKRDILNRKPIYNDAKLLELQKQLQKFTEVDYQTKMKHIKSVKMKQEKY